MAHHWMRTIICAFLLLGAGPALAAPYFNADKVPPFFITPPLTPQSAEWKKEIETIINLQRTPSAAEIAKAGEEGPLTPEIVVQAVMPTLTRAAYPKTYAWLDRVEDTAQAATHGAKSYWNTRRPYLSDPRVKALIASADNPSYPSGHTSVSFVWAHVMALLYPDKRDAFYRRAEEIAEHRVLVGMHYPHDLDGGYQLALLIIGGLMQNADFQADLAQAKAELNIP